MLIENGISSETSFLKIEQRLLESITTSNSISVYIFWEKLKKIITKM